MAWFGDPLLCAADEADRGTYAQTGSTSHGRGTSQQCSAESQRELESGCQRDSVLCAQVTLDVDVPLETDVDSTDASPNANADADANADARVSEAQARGSSGADGGADSVSPVSSQDDTSLASTVDFAAVSASQGSSPGDSVSSSSPSRSSAEVRRPSRPRGPSPSRSSRSRTRTGSDLGSSSDPRCPEQVSNPADLELLTPTGPDADLDLEALLGPAQRMDACAGGKARGGGADACKVAGPCASAAARLLGHIAPLLEVHERLLADLVHAGAGARAYPASTQAQPATSAVTGSGGATRSSTAGSLSGSSSSSGAGQSTGSVVSGAGAGAGVGVADGPNVDLSMVGLQASVASASAARFASVCAALAIHLPRIALAYATCFRQAPLAGQFGFPFSGSNFLI